MKAAVDGFATTDPGKMIPYIDSTFRTIADKNHRAFAGLSMGRAHVWTV
jgi:hypothetical protein